jgi:nitroreductase
MDRLQRILDTARWAPSGDNTQPWRFEIVDAGHLVVHGFDTREHCVYDLDGHASQLAIGCLLETLAIAASEHGLRAEFTRRPGTPEHQTTLDVALTAEAGIVADPLIPCIRERRVQRRMMSTRPLAGAKEALTRSLAPDYQVVWKETWPQRWSLARLMFANAYVRLTTPEAYRVHRDVIEWNSRFSETRIPDQAVGADPLTLKLMRWAMHSWERVDFLNRYLMGTLMPRLQMDLLPGLACGAHFAIVAAKPPVDVDDYLAAGRQVQRLWLTATRLGLEVQPEMTPLIFSRYVREGREFSSLRRPGEIAANLAGRLAGEFAPIDPARLVFLGRIGAGPQATARSTRLPVERLLRSD